MTIFKEKISCATLIILYVLVFSSCSEGATAAQAEKDVVAEINSSQQTKKLTEDDLYGDIIVKEKDILIAVDISGSMGRSYPAIEDMLKLITVLLEEESTVSSVEYLTFNADEVCYVEYNELFPLHFNKQTSVYKGFNEINDWIEKKTAENESTMKSAGVFVFSDMFSSRDQNGKLYTVEIANNEQQIIKQWTQNWLEIQQQGKLNICYFTWESDWEGESKEKVLEKLDEENVRDGFQVVLDSQTSRKCQIDIDEAIGKNKYQVFEKELMAVRQCACEALKVITGLDNLKWKEGGSIKEWKNPIQVNLDPSYRTYILLDYSTIEQGTIECICDSNIKKEVESQLLFEGNNTKLLVLNNSEKQKLSLQTQEAGANLYFLTIPNIKFDIYVKKVGSITVGEPVVLHIEPNCPTDDVRWNQFDKEMGYYIEVINETLSTEVLKKCLPLSQNELEIVCEEPGDIDIIVSCTRSDEGIQKIGGCKIVCEEN